MDTHAIRPIEILLVDDHPGDVRLAQEALHDGKLRNRLQIARTGEEALAYLRREHPFTDARLPDLLLLDLGLPRLDGRAVLRAVRADTALRALPVAIMVASRQDWAIVERDGIETRYFLTKPLEVSRLLALIGMIDTFGLAIVAPHGDVPGAITFRQSDLATRKEQHEWAYRPRLADEVDYTPADPALRHAHEYNEELR